MSRASEWRQAKDASRPRFTVPMVSATGATVSAWAEVNDVGGIHIVTPDMSPGDARRLARWILDTFGDEP